MNSMCDCMSQSPLSKNRQRTRRWLPRALLLVGSMTGTVTATLIGDEIATPITGTRLRQELHRPINVTRPDVRLREIVERLSELHNVAILLDRRLDPDQHIDVQLNQITLNDGLEFLARQVNADAAIVGGTIMISPDDALDRIRTDLAIQHQSLRETPALSSGMSFQWDDLQTPHELVPVIAERFGVVISGLDLIPHDLWAAGKMADVNATEALLLVVGQYDLTCRWNEAATAVQLAPAPARQTIEKTITASPERFAAARVKLQAEVPLAEISSHARKLRIVATLAEHERIEALLKGDADDSAEPASDQGPVRDRTFTLTTERASVIAILRTLESQGTLIEYDAIELQSAGIDLSQRVTLSLDKATADEFFQALCDPLGLQFEIDNKTIRLSPARSP